MRRTVTCLWALALAGLFSSPALADDQAGSKSGSSGQASSNVQSKQGQQAQNAPDGWILIEEQVVMLTANEPQNHFLRAQQLLGQNDAKAAAAEVNVGAAYLDMQGARSNKGADDQLKSAADRLRQLAGEVRKAGNGDVQHLQQQLAETFASANYALAKHFQDLTTQDVGGKKAIAAGYDLRGAADSLAAAYVWSKMQAPQEAASAIADARRTADQLISVESTTGSQAQSTDNARTAGAKQGSSSGQATATIPPDASKVVDQLGKVIQQSSGSFKAAGDQKADATKTK
jgi:hypothetical protein